MCWYGNNFHCDFYLGMLSHTCKPISWETEIRRSRIWGQPELHSKTLSPNNKMFSVDKSSILILNSKFLKNCLEKNTFNQGSLIKHPFETHTLQSAAQNTKATRMPAAVPLDSCLLGRTWGPLTGWLTFFKAGRHLLQDFIGKASFSIFEKSS